MFQHVFVKLNFGEEDNCHNTIQTWTLDVGQKWFCSGIIWNVSKSMQLIVCVQNVKWHSKLNVVPKLKIPFENRWALGASEPYYVIKNHFLKNLIVP